MSDLTNAYVPGFKQHVYLLLSYVWGWLRVLGYKQAHGELGSRRYN